MIGNETVPDDFCVIRDGRTIGRIRMAQERSGHQPGWDWAINVPLPIPPWCVGNAGSREAAQTAFKDAWTKFYAALAPNDIEHWHHHQDAAAKR